MRLLISLFICGIFGIDDPWAVLGVSRSASTKQIKSAYKKLAKEWHPDVNKSPEAEEKFVDIAEAYQILTDDEKKQEWERNRNSGFGSSFRSKSSRAGAQWGFSADDLFRQFFGSSNFGEEGVTTRDFFNNILVRTNRTPYVFLFTSPWCMECQHASKYFALLENDFKKFGFGSGKINANVQPKLAEFMHVKRVPALVVVFKEDPYHYNVRELFTGNTVGIRDFCHSLAASTVSVPYLKDVEETVAFIDSYSSTLRLRIWLLTDKPTLSSTFTTVASQFLGEADFAYSNFANEDLDQIRESYKIKEPSVLLFSDSSEKPVSVTPTASLKKGELFKLIKNLRFRDVTRISHQEQLDDRCPVTYEERQPLCLVYIHFGDFDSNQVKQFLAWGRKNSEEMDKESRIVIISGNNQKKFAKSLGISSSDAVLIQRHPRGSSQYLKIAVKEKFEGFTAAVWKGIFSKDEFEWTNLENIVDESSNDGYLGNLYRKAWSIWRRFRHLEEEELLIFIAVPLAILMFSATFLIGGNSEHSARRRPQPTRQQKQNTVDITVRHLKTVDLDEVSKMTSDSVRYLVILLVKGANDTSEAEKEIMVEMTRQFAVKAQDLKYDPHKPDFFVCDVTKVSPEVSPELGLCAGTVLALSPNWWSAYQLDSDDDIYMDNILPYLEHWLSRLQDGAVKRHRY